MAPPAYKRRRSLAVTELQDSPRVSNTAKKAKSQHERSIHKPASGWTWSSGDRDDQQRPVKGEHGRTYYHHATFMPADAGQLPYRIAVEDLVATEVNMEDEETRELKLKYWIGQVAALFEVDGEMRFILRFFDLPVQWRYMNGDDNRLIKSFGDSFRKFELLETDVCEENPIEIVKKKLNWWSTEPEAVSDNKSCKNNCEIPNGFFTDRMVIRCGADGKRRDDLSDSLWPAKAGRRRNRLIVQCAASKQSLKAGWQISMNEQVGEGSDPAYSRAVEALKLSVLPENLPCREEETATIREFVKQAVKSLGTSGNVLYISGVPGTGKTASVLSVVKQMQKSATSKDQKFDFAYINSMKLNTPTDLYVDLMNKMWIHKRKFKADKPQEKLTEYFTTVDKNRPVTVLLVDEIDYLVNKSQAVVYQLFDWPLLASSKLILLTISNTMDLPERLMPRVASRFGLARLNYLPYNHEQIGKVIRQRLKEADAEKVFAEDAIRLASLRVANNSGDVRKALQICRRAIEVREGPVVKAQDINRAQNDLYSSPFVAVMSHLPYLARLVLIALVKETETKNTGSVILRDVYYRFTNLAKTFAPAFQPRSLYYSDFQRVVSDLKQQSLVKVAKQTAASLTSYQAEATRMSAETPDLSELNLLEANATRQSKKTTGTAKHKTIQKDNHADEDEDGANYLICLNELIEGTEVRKALIDEAGDRVAQRILL